MAQYDLIIVGAGISGLSLAHYCRNHGLDVLVIEKDGRTGGCFHSHRPDGENFWIELGAHTCYNSYLGLIGIIEDMRISGRIVRRERVPFRLLAGDDIRSIMSGLHFGELLLSLPRIAFLRKEGMSVSSYYTKIFGKRNFEEVLSPAFDAVISQKADDFPAEMLFKKRKKRRDILKSFTLGGGIQTITDSIASQPGLKVVQGQEVEAVLAGKDHFGISTMKDSYTASFLAVATDASAAARLLKPCFGELSSLLSRVGSRTVETMGVVIPREKVPVRPMAGLIAIDDSFYSAVSRDTVSDERYRGFSFHFRNGAAGRDEKLKRIGDVLRVALGDIEHVVEKENRVPSLAVGHRKLVDEIDGIISGSRLLLTGNYFSGLAIEDCVSRSLAEFLRLKTMQAAWAGPR